MQVPTDKKQSRQKRIMTYFIDAASQIIRAEGLAAVTIRKVADLAGYNSATLYNYFEHLEHLVFLASLECLEAYAAAIPACTAGCDNPLEEYLAIIKCFCRHAFASPALYERLLSISRDNKLEEYIGQYDMLFPDRLKTGATSLLSVLSPSGSPAGTPTLLTPCVAEGYLTQEDADAFAEVALMIYRCILQDVKEGRLTSEDAVAKNFSVHRRVMTCYLRPEHRGLLEVHKI